MRRLSEGDEHAFRSLFDIYKIRLFSFVYNFTHLQIDAEEVIQDTFLKLWEKRDDLNKVDNPGAYIYTIARNTTLNYLRKAARDDKLLKKIWTNIKDAENFTEQILQAKESQQLVDEALSQLSEKKQTIFRLSRQEGLSLDEIALQTGLSKSTVKNILGETLRYVKQHLQQHSITLSLIFWLHVIHLTK